MHIVTHDGRFLTGRPDEILRILAEHIGTLGSDWRRVERYRETIGSEFAAFSARQILDGLDQEGTILIRSADPVRPAR